jgi:hypothetical protein
MMWSNQIAGAPNANDAFHFALERFDLHRHSSRVALWLLGR